MRFSEGENCLDDGNAATPVPVCTAGNCVTPGGTAPACATPVDCPDFQACVAGVCRSQCELDLECGAGRLCHRKVCRTSCSASSSSCGAGTTSEIHDVQNGACVDTVPTGEGEVPAVPGSFEVSNVRVSSTFTITNRSPLFQQFTVRKLEHTEFTASGQVSVTQDPLQWMRLGPPGNATQVQD